MVFSVSNWARWKQLNDLNQEPVHWNESAELNDSLKWFRLEERNEKHKSVYANDRQLSIADDDDDGGEGYVESSKVNVMDMWNKDASCVSFRVDVGFLSCE